MKRIPRRIFTAEFKLEAVKLVTEHGLTQAEAARKLDIATSVLSTNCQLQSCAACLMSPKAATIVGWAMDKQMTKQLVVDALRSAYWRKKPAKGLIHHSDRGSQYCSAAYRALQDSYGMVTSMSRRGNCWDNAPMESFFGTIKTESLHHYRFSTREEARLIVFEYIEVFYNRIRRHTKINNTAPATYAAQFNSTVQQMAA